ncbi:MAG: hypothetical protein VXZ39_02285 [Planctomycetota bacterium]|nr:hypothetical protein [Planctomycetota bacterium]
MATSAAIALAACVTAGPVPMMGSARIAADFDTYRLQRVALLPFRAVDRTSGTLAAHEVGTLETSFHAELASATPYDLIPLRGEDLAAVLPPDPFRDGWYTPDAIRLLRDRFHLDGIMVGTITSRRVVPPQVLGVQLDLISCETGATIWSADLMLDAARNDVQEAVAVWSEGSLGKDDGGAMVLLSPRRYAHFAAHQLARLL